MALATSDDTTTGSIAASSTSAAGVFSHVDVRRQRIYDSLHTMWRDLLMNQCPVVESMVLTCSQVSTESVRTGIAVQRQGRR